MSLLYLMPAFSGPTANNTLSVPTMTASNTETYPVSAQSRMKFATDGHMDDWNGAYQQRTENPNAWIHADSKDPLTVNAADYEVRYILVSGNTADQHGSSDTWYTTDPGAEVGWISLDTHGFWGISYLGDNEVRSVTGTMEIREKANTSNKASGTVTISAQQDGPS